MGYIPCPLYWSHWYVTPLSQTVTQALQSSTVPTHFLFPQFYHRLCRNLHYLSHLVVHPVVVHFQVVYPLYTYKHHCTHKDVEKYQKRQGMMCDPLAFIRSCSFHTPTLGKIFWHAQYAFNSFSILYSTLYPHRISMYLHLPNALYIFLVSQNFLNAVTCYKEESFCDIFSAIPAVATLLTAWNMCSAAWSLALSDSIQLMVEVKSLYITSNKPTLLYSPPPSLG